MRVRVEDDVVIAESAVMASESRAAVEAGRAEMFGEGSAWARSRLPIRQMDVGALSAGEGDRYYDPGDRTVKSFA